MTYVKTYQKYEMRMTEDHSHSADKDWQKTVRKPKPRWEDSCIIVISQQINQQDIDSKIKNTQCLQKKKKMNICRQIYRSKKEKKKDTKIPKYHRQEEIN